MIQVSINKEMMGAFIDAVYAIAVTILALEIPDDLTGTQPMITLMGMVLNYAISFIVLFALWFQHRRINQHIDVFNHLAIWINAGIMLFVCLVPRATTLVFKYGADVTFQDIEISLFHSSNWTIPEVVDLSFVSIILAADLGLTMLLLCARLDDVLIKGELRRSKLTITFTMLVIFGLSFLLPLNNHLFLVFLPVLLILEKRISRLFWWVETD